MNSTKIIFGLALIAFSCVSLSYSVRCYVCNSKDSCKRAQLYQCTPELANATRTYLQIYHSGVSNATSYNYDCFSEYIKTTGFSLRCYVCDDKKSCRNPKLYECTPQLAIETRAYLLQFHSDIDIDATSSDYACFREYLKVGSTEYYFKSCAFTNVDGCEAPLNTYIFNNLDKQVCRHCTGRDGCNPANRIDINVLTIVTAMLLAAVLRWF